MTQAILQEDISKDLISDDGEEELTEKELDQLIYDSFRDDIGIYQQLISKKLREKDLLDLNLDPLGLNCSTATCLLSFDTHIDNINRIASHSILLPSLKEMKGINVFCFKHIIDDNIHKSIIINHFLCWDYGKEFIQKNHTYIHSLFFVNINGRKIIYAIVDVLGNLVYSSDFLKLYADYRSAEEFSELLNYTVEFMIKLKEKFFSNNFDLLKKDIIALTLLRAIPHKQTSHIKGILSHIDYELNDIFIKQGDPTQLQYCIFNTNQIYKNSISEIMKSVPKKIREGFNRGLNTGIILNTCMEKNGYKIINNSGEIKWSKSVNIIPDKCFHKNCLYEILPEHRKWYVNNLILTFYNNELSILTQDAFHPNINGLHVCIGSTMQSKWIKIRENIEENIELFVEYLQDIELTLQTINFDSSYTTPARNLLSKGIQPYKKEIITKYNKDITKAKTWMVIE